MAHTSRDPHRILKFIMPAPKPPAFETLSLHAGQHPDPVTGARAVPIYQTTSYVSFQDSEARRRTVSQSSSAPGRSPPGFQTRPPPCSTSGWRLAAEGGVGAICTASGMAAMHLAIATLLGAGDHIVASSCRFMAAPSICCAHIAACASAYHHQLRQAARAGRIPRRAPAQYAARDRRNHRQSRP